MGTWKTLLLAILVVDAHAAAPPLTFLQYNVGNADVGCPPRLPAPAHSLRLHDPKDIARVRAFVEATQPDGILLQEVLEGKNPFTDPVNPLLPPGYEGRCPVQGSHGDGLVCIAWKRASLRLAAETDCFARSLFTEPGTPAKGAIVACRLRHGEQPIQLVSAYIPHGKERDWWGDNGRDNVNRRKVLSWIWENRDIDLEAPLVVGGDFNTQNCTGMSENNDSCDKPYPPTLGTLYGSHLAGYGRWTPRDSFFGHVLMDGTTASHVTEVTRVCGIVVNRNKIDHVFANFGEPSRVEIPLGGRTLDCGAASCLPGIPGFKLPEQLKCRSCDHLPIIFKLDKTGG